MSSLPAHTPIRPVLFGEVLFDCFGTQQVAGGAPLNVAWHLHALGWNPLLISRVGEDDLGQKVNSRMQEWGMDTSAIQLDPDRPTGRVEVQMSGGGHTFHILENQAYDRICPEIALRSVDPAKTAVLYHGSLALRGPSKEALQQLRGTTVAPLFLDINLRSPWWDKEAVLEMIRHASQLKLNDEELRLLCPESLRNKPLEELAGRVCSDWNLDVLWLTLGAEGSYYCNSAGLCFKTPIAQGKDPVADTVGAGDAFCAAVLGGFLKGSDPQETAACAALLASRICSQRGATADNPSLYEGLGAVTNDCRKGG